MNIAIFASGAGSNAEVIIKTLPALLNNKDINVALILSNNAEAGVLHIAEAHSIPWVVLDTKNIDHKTISSAYLTILAEYKIDYIVLAGYLKKIPQEVIAAFPQKIVNIHPALLPAYGGRGMYGMHVHETVVAAGESKSGITIHYVDEVYDNGKIIFQAVCDLDDGETGSSLAKKIQDLEHTHYSQIISKILLSQFPVK